MNLDPNINKWVISSLAKNFSVLTPFTIEGQEIREQLLESERYILRVDGPEISKISKNNWKLYFNVNVAIHTFRNNQDLYTPYKRTGVVGQLFLGKLPVYKFGDGDFFLGCLKLISNVAVTVFSVAKDSKLIQGSVEATFEMEYFNGPD